MEKDFEKQPERQSTESPKDEAEKKVAPVSPEEKQAAEEANAEQRHKEAMTERD